MHIPKGSRKESDYKSAQAPKANGRAATTSKQFEAGGLGFIKHYNDARPPTPIKY